MIEKKKKAENMPSKYDFKLIAQNCLCEDL